MMIDEGAGRAYSPMLFQDAFEVARAYTVDRRAWVVYGDPTGYILVDDSGSIRGRWVYSRTINIEPMAATRAYTQALQAMVLEVTLDSAREERA